MMKTIIKDTLALVIITVVAGLCLSTVHELTAEKISAAEADERTRSYREVFPEASDFISPDGFGVSDYDLSPLDGVTVGEALYAVDGEGNILGCVISSTSANGYGGNITLSVGVDTSTTVTGMTVTSMSESPGFGSHCQDEEFQEQFKGVTGEVKYVSGGKSAPNEIDMISGATFTSSAVTEAVNGALKTADELCSAVAGGSEGGEQR